MAVVGLCCFVPVFSGYGEWGLVFVVVCGLLLAEVSCCGTWALGPQTLVVAADRLCTCDLKAPEH